MEQILQLRSIDVGQLVGRHNVYAGKQIGCVILRASDAGLNLSACDTDLVNQFAMLSNVGMIGLAPQHVNRAAFDVVWLQRIAE